MAGPSWSYVLGRLELLDLDEVLDLEDHPADHGVVLLLDRVVDPLEPEGANGTLLVERGNRCRS